MTTTIRHTALHTTIDIRALATARAEEEYVGLEAGSWSGLTLAAYVERTVEHLTHPTIDGVTYDLTRRWVDRHGRVWECRGWDWDRNVPVVDVVDRRPLIAPIPLASLLELFAPLRPLT